ncbi:and other transporter-domain-containing protein, partial [Clohesyomyces aquaticus]
LGLLGVYSIIKGVTHSFTMLFLLDRFGRRPLNLIGSVSITFTMYYMAAFTSITGSFHSTREPGASSKSALAMFYLYGASYSLGWGLVFIVNSEIYPNRVHGFCVAWATRFHWIGELCTSFAIAYRLKKFFFGTFVYFGTCTILGGVFSQMFVPETNGKSLENMDVMFEAKGLAWRQMRTWGKQKVRQMMLEGRGVGEEIEEMNSGPQVKEFDSKV